MQEAKSEEASRQRVALFKPRGSAAAAARPRAPVHIKVKNRSSGYMTVTATGHMDEVQELAQGGTKMGAVGK